MIISTLSGLKRQQLLNITYMLGMDDIRRKFCMRLLSKEYHNYHNYCFYSILMKTDNKNVKLLLNVCSDKLLLISQYWTIIAPYDYY